MVGISRLEREASAMSTQRSNQLSYIPLLPVLIALSQGLFSIDLSTCCQSVLRLKTTTGNFRQNLIRHLFVTMKAHRVSRSSLRDGAKLGGIAEHG